MRDGTRQDDTPRAIVGEVVGTMADASENPRLEAPASETEQSPASSTASDQGAGDDISGLPDWARRQMQQAPDAPPAEDEAGAANETADDGTAGLPDWAAQKLSQMDDSGETPASADTPSDDSEGGLPSWAVQKMQEFSANEPDDAQAGRAGSPVQPLPATTGADSAPELASTGPQISPQFAQHAPNLELMLDLPLDVSVELGHAELPLAHVLGLKAGSVVQLDKLPGEPLDLLVNGQLVARGEIVVLNDTFAFRITDLIED